MKKFTVYYEQELLGCDVFVSQFEKIGQAVMSHLSIDVELCCEIVFMEQQEMQQLNNDTRQIDSVTDVLSYPNLNIQVGKQITSNLSPIDYNTDGSLFLGSVVICLSRAREQAEQYGHSYEREISFLALHGMLHCLGYDHMTSQDEEQMNSVANEILCQLGIER